MKLDDFAFHNAVMLPESKAAQGTTDSKIRSWQNLILDRPGIHVRHPAWGENCLPRKNDACGSSCLTSWRVPNSGSDNMHKTRHARQVIPVLP